MPRLQNSQRGILGTYCCTSNVNSSLRFAQDDKLEWVRALSLPALELVERRQKPVDVRPRKVIRRRQAQLMGFGAADANFLFFPQPVLEVHPDEWRHIHRRNRAAQERVGRSPGLGTAPDHGFQKVVAELA